MWDLLCNDLHFYLFRSLLSLAFWQTVPAIYLTAENIATTALGMDGLKATQIANQLN